jgi:hypothetical protein
MEHLSIFKSFQTPELKNLDATVDHFSLTNSILPILPSNSTKLTDLQGRNPRTVTSRFVKNSPNFVKISPKMEP